MKKILIVLLSVVLVLCGCNKQDDGKNDKDKEAVKVLAEAISEYDGMYIYYCNSDDFANSKPKIGIDQFIEVTRAILFVKEGEIIDSFDLDHMPDAKIIDKVFKGDLDNMVKKIDPGCSDGC